MNEKTRFSGELRNLQSKFLVSQKSKGFLRTHKAKRFMNNKRAIELSINFVVIMVLSIAILASSFILVKQFFGKAEETRARLDAETETKIRNMLVAGERVAIPIHTKEVKAGKGVTFAVGISNVLIEAYDPQEPNIDSFQVFTDQSLCEDVKKSTAPKLKTSVMSDPKIRKNEDTIVLVLVDTTGAIPGLTYKCDIKVEYYDGIIEKDWLTYADPVYKAYIKIT